MLCSIFTLLLQLFVLGFCCSGVGLILRFLLPNEFSLLHKVLFSLLGGLFLVVLVAQNLVYLGVPVRISAWVVLGVALVQVWWCRHNFLTRIRTLCANADIRTLTVIILLVILFHGIVPIRQGLEWYYGKGHDDQLNCVLTAEFLKEEPYGTSGKEIALRPWLVRPVGNQETAKQMAMISEPEEEMIALKKEKIGQSILTAEISVWSGTDAKGGYAAAVIFFITLLAICLYVLLRETGLDRFMAGSGALAAAFLPAVTRLSLDGFLSEASILFVFPFFAIMLRHQELSARSFTLFFSLTLAYLVAAYSEIAPIAFCTFFLGVMLVRQDKFRSKRLMLMGAILLIALMNPFYLRNLIGFLRRQYYLAANAHFLEPYGAKRSDSARLVGAHFRHRHQRAIRFVFRLLRHLARPSIPRRSYCSIQARQTDLWCDTAPCHPRYFLFRDSDPPFLLPNCENHADDFALRDRSGVRCSVQDCGKEPGSCYRSAKETTLRGHRGRCSGRIRPVLFRSAQQRRLAEIRPGTSFSKCLP